MKEIPLAGGKVALVDDDMFDYLNQWHWFLFHGYAARWIYVAKYKRKLLFMHRVIVNTPNNMFTDHINGDKLDDQRNNLRSCTMRQNNCNMGVRKDNKTGFKGVTHRGYKYGSYIRHLGKKKYLGTFDSVIDAALAYDKAAKELHGEFANTNFK